MTENSQARAITRIAIVNRGEPAVRFLRAVVDYNLERGTALQAVALYTDPDDGAPFVRLADDAVRLGPAFRPGRDGALISAYLDHEHVIGLLQAAGCDAVWPGWGFVSEDADFVDKLELAGITFLGPSGAAMRALGDKIASKHLAEVAGVPMAPWWLVPDGVSAEELAERAAAIGFPLMIKASGGGGGRGIRRVERSEDLLSSLAAVREEVRKFFGKGGVFLERCVTAARHVEVQLVCGADGKATAVGMRDCSVQRRNQKVIEEAPAPNLPPDKAEIAMRASERLAELAHYRGVATAEFLYRPDDGQLSFLEVNSRLQVEHTVTELVTGADLVQAQIDIARGLPWRKPEPGVHGHAIEVRLNAENAERGFAPAPGLVRVFRVPAGPGIRVDSGIVQGQSIAPEFDSMVAKVMAWAPTRPQAIARLRRALLELEAVVEDGATNKAFLLDLLQNSDIVGARADTGWLDRAMASGVFGAPAYSFEALLVASIIAFRTHRHADIARFFAQAQNGIPNQLPEPKGVAVELKLRGQTYPFVVHGVGRDRYCVVSPGNSYDLTLEPIGTHSAVLHLHGLRRRILFSTGRTGIVVEVDGAMHVVERATGGVVQSPAPALVVHVAVKEGDTIAVGDPLLTLEAMKMEMPLFATEAGVVRTVLCRSQQQVGAGQALLLVDPEQSGDEVATTQAAPALMAPPLRALDLLGDRPTLLALDGLSEADARQVVQAVCDVGRCALLGWDVPEADLERAQRLLASDHDVAGLQHPSRLLPLVGLLGDFVAVESLFERNLLPVPGGAESVTAELAYYDACRRHHEGEGAVSTAFLPLLLQALRGYDVHTWDASDHLREALWRMAVAHATPGPRHRWAATVLRLTIDMHLAGVAVPPAGLAESLERIAQLASGDHRTVADHARQAAYLIFEQSRYVQRREVVESLVDDVLARWYDAPEVWQELVQSTHSLAPILARRTLPRAPTALPSMQALLHRWYRDLDPRAQLSQPHGILREGHALLLLDVAHDGRGTTPITIVGLSVSLRHCDIATELETAAALVVAGTDGWVELFVHECQGDTEAALATAMQNRSWPQIVRVTATWDTGGVRPRHSTWHASPEGLREDPLLRDIHPETARRIELWRLSEFDVERLDAPEQVVAYRGRARTNPDDERIFVFAEVRDLPLGAAQKERREAVWDFEQAWYEGLRVIRGAQSLRDSRNRLHMNRITFAIRPVMRLDVRDVARLSRNLEAPARGLGLEKVVISARVPDRDGHGVRTTVFTISKPGRHRMQVQEQPPGAQPIRAMTPYEMKVVRSRRMGTTYPYDIVRLLEGAVPGAVLPHPDMTNGRFAEYDLDDSGERLVPVHRPPGGNQASVVVGVMVHYTAKYPDGMERVWIASDPTMAMGALSEPECRRILAAIDLADERGLAVEWIPLSSGARIAMDSGTENLDWTARVLRRIIEFTQSGGDIHVIVTGINVGAQSYWNAEATMLMHTRGCLIMTPDAAMVLTGKKALEVSGGVAAEDERGIGGMQRIMGPNGEAQYGAADLGQAYAILFEHYRFAWRRAGEAGPRTMHTSDPDDRSILHSPYRAQYGESFATVGEIFDDRTNPGRKKPFAIREVMAALIDRDGGSLERWATMLHAETAVVWDAHVGGHPVCLIGFESRPMPRRGRIPLDGPDTWTGGTLFPRSSKKVARAINAASGIRPVVVLANLSGFDGSPESLRKWQLEHGAEIGRAVVNFRGPILFVVVGRYHGGAYVVFSKALNPNLTALALEGSFASVIGGGPAAAVVFPRDVRRRAEQDPRVAQARARLKSASDAQRPRLRELAEAALAEAILDEQGRVAREFDAIHSVERAVRVGSLDAVIAADQLRPEVVRRLHDAVGG